MDRNEFSLRVEALKAAMHQRDYEKAVEIADDLELRKIRDNNLLSMVADAYELNHEYDRSRDALLTAYENTNAGRQLAYRLCLISIKTKEFDEAEGFYEDFVEMAPRDTGRYILKYKMAKAKGEPIEKQIRILEEYVNIDMEEKWAYELTKLYHLAGDQEKCVDMCDEISLWFSEGKYVLKALELKQKYVPLSVAQKQKYEEEKKKILEEAAREEMQVIPQDDNIIEIYPEDDEQNVNEEKEYVEKIPEEPQSIDISKFDTMDIQAVIAEGMKEVALEEANIHEGEGSTKVAEGKIPFIEISKQNESDQAFKPSTSLDLNLDDIAENEEKISEEIVNESEPETTVEAPVIESLGDVQDMLKVLQERGILKAETVEQAVTIIEEAGNEENKELDEELAKIDQGLDEVIFKESEEEKEDSTDEEFDQKISSTQQIMLAEQKEIEEEEPVVAKETVAIPNLQFIRDEIQNEQSDQEEKQNSEPEKKEEEPEHNEPENQNPSEENIETANEIPVLDLSFQTPKRDTSKDVGKKELYENIVANSDLGNITDKIPSSEEIERAIREAEQNELKDSNEGLRATASLSAAVEVISGTDWTQNDEEKKPEDEQEEKLKAEKIETPQEELKEEKIEIPKKEIAVPIEESEVDDVDEREELVDDKVESGADTEGTEESVKEPKNGESEESANKPESGEPEESDESEDVLEESEETNQAEENEADEQEDSMEKSEDDKSEEPEQTIVKGHGVKLSEIEMSVFKNYLNVEGLEDSIRETVETLIAEYSPDGKSTEGNVIILGNKKTGKTTLAIEMIKLVNAKRGRRNRKLAKVNATALNKRGFRNSLNKLIGCDLVVEHAHELGVMTISEIIDCSGMFTDDMLIVLEGDTDGMEMLLKNTPRIKEVFNHVIHIREYNIKEWVEYGKRYAEEKGYVMDELASLAFYKAIDDCFGSNNGIKQEHVESILDDAIARRSRKLFGAKKNEDGLIILIEKNFR